MKPMPPELDMAAEEADMTLAQGLQSSMPRPVKPFDPRVVSFLYRVLNKCAKVMGTPIALEPELKAVDSMTPEAVRYLAMMLKAATDYGSPPPVSLEQIRTDQDLIAITAFLESLHKDPEFKAWLKETPPKGEEMEEPEVMEEVEVEETPQDLDMLFKSRSKR